MNANRSRGLCAAVGLTAAFLFTSSISGAVARAAETSEAASTAFGGPNSVAVDLATDRHRRLAPANLNLGGDYFIFGQVASDSPGEDAAASGVARVYGTWTLFEGKNGGQGTLVFKGENRHKYTDIAPQDLGFEVGYAGLTAITASDADWLLTNLFWQQALARDRFSYVAGIVDPADYIDIYWLADPWSGFSNLAFSTNPALPLPEPGVGAAGRVLLGERGYLLAGVMDANADPKRPQDAFESFFDDAEFFTHIELGWTASYADRFTDNVHLTLWHADARQATGVSSGRGFAFSASWHMGEHWVPFARFGASAGGGPILDRTLSLGTGYQPGRQDDTIGLGINIGRPAEDSFGGGLDEQVTFEAFYRIRVHPHITITPDVQFIQDPAFRDDTDSIWILGVRARATL